MIFNTTRVLQFALASTFFMAASACKTVNNGAGISPDIVTDSLSVNEAYSDTTNAIILKNILRARDRWPTSYTTLSAVTSRPTATDKAGFSFTPLGLGNATGPFTGSSSSYDSTRKADKSYIVSPFASSEEAGATSLYKPVKKEVYQKYMSVWPSDVITLMMVQGVELSEPDKYREYIPISSAGNDGENQYKFIVDVAKLLGVNPAQFDFKNDIELVVKDTNSECLIDQLTFDQIVHTSNPAIENIKKLNEAMAGSVKLEASDTANVVNVKTCKSKDDGIALTLKPSAKYKSAFYNTNIDVPKLDFDTRSFDGMIYYLGEVSRKVDQNVVQSPCKTAVPTMNGHMMQVPKLGPVFRIVDSRMTGGLSYAAKVNHDGQKYYAVPNFMRAAHNYQCPAERTSTALSILTQLLVLNQSSDFLEAPQNTFLSAP